MLFYFTLKAFFILKIFYKLSSYFFILVKKQLDQKDKVDFKIYDVTSWLINNCNKHIDQYLKKKANQAIKFGQLIVYNMRNIFLEKSHKKVDQETIPRPFSKKFKLSISLDQQSEVSYSLFLLYAKLSTIKRY